MNTYVDQITNIKSMIAKGDVISIPANCTDCVIILGNTGSGKSTLLNYLSGIETSAIKSASKISDKLVIDVTNQSSTNHIKINHTTVSDTTTPNLRPIGDTLFADCPGFSDNRGSGQDIANAYYIKRILRASPTVKIIIVMEIEMFDGKALKFFDLINLLGEMFSNIDQIRRGTMIVMSKVDPSVTAMAIVEHLQTIRADHTHLTSAQTHLIEFFIESADQIALFHRPNRIGPVNHNDGVCIMQKLSVLEPINAATIKISVSDKSKVFVIDLLTETHDNIIEMNNTLCADICINVTQLKKELCTNICTPLTKICTTEIITIEPLDIMINLLQIVHNIVTKNSYQIDDIIQLGSQLGLGSNTNAMALTNCIAREVGHFQFFSELNPIKKINFEQCCLNVLSSCTKTIERQIKTPTNEIIHKISEDTKMALSDFFIKTEEIGIESTMKMTLTNKLNDFFILGRNMQFIKDHLFNTNVSTLNSFFDMTDYKNIHTKLLIYDLIMQKYTDEKATLKYHNSVVYGFENLTQTLMKNLIEKQTSNCTIL